MRRIAAPMVGGMISATVLTLLVIPAIYSLWQEATLRLAARESGQELLGVEPLPAGGD
jgi:Cu(I)/Ag(I) efflux system membrane protein CusA/SilA